MTRVECSECNSEGLESNVYTIPLGWIRVRADIDEATRLLCSWGCAEKLCKRMKANQEHPSDNRPRIPPARVGTTVDPSAVDDPRPAEPAIEITASDLAERGVCDGRREHHG